MNSKLKLLALTTIIVLANPNIALAGKAKICIFSGCAKVRTYNNPQEGRRQLRVIKNSAQNGARKTKNQLRRLSNTVGRRTRNWRREIGRNRKNWGRTYIKFN